MNYIILIIVLLVLYYFFVELFYGRRNRISPPTSKANECDVMGQSKFDLRQFTSNCDQNSVYQDDPKLQPKFVPKDETLISLDENLIETELEDEESENEMASALNFEELEKVVKVIKFGGNKNEQKEIVPTINKLQGSELMVSILDQIEGSREAISKIMDEHTDYE